MPTRSAASAQNLQREGRQLDRAPACLGRLSRSAGRSLDSGGPNVHRLGHLRTESVSTPPLSPPPALTPTERQMVAPVKLYNTVCLLRSNT